MTNKIFYFLIAVTFLFVSHNLRAAEIELGAGTFFTSLPKYLGSEEQNSYTLPFPYFYYRSDKLEIERNSFTRYFWQQNNWYLDFSATGNLPVESKKTKIRKAMPDLDFVGQLGPEIKHYLIGSPNSAEQFSVAFNIRKAVATDLTYLSSVGWHSSIAIAYNTKLPAIFNGELELNTRLNLNAADHNYLDYYYGVKPQYQTTQRSYYTATSGYFNHGLSFGLTWQKEAIWMGGFLKYNSLSNSKIQTSPLVTDTENWSFGLGLVWIFYRNKT